MIAFVVFDLNEAVGEVAPDLAPSWEGATASMAALADFAVESGTPGTTKWAAFAVSDGKVTRMVAGCNDGTAEELSEAVRTLEGNLEE
jgi:hypothetical protein